MWTAENREQRAESREQRLEIAEESWVNK